MSQCVQAEKLGVLFWGLGVKASLDKTGFCRDIISPSRAAVSSSRMWPILSAVLPSAAPHPNPSPSIPLSPCHLHPWDFPPVSIHFAHSHLLLPAASFLPCSCLPIPVRDFSVVLVLLCLSMSPSASPVLVPQPQDPALAVLLLAPQLLRWL